MSMSLSLVDGEGIRIGDDFKEKYVAQFEGNEDKMEEAECFVEDLTQQIWERDGQNTAVSITEVDDEIYIYLPPISAKVQNNQPRTQMSEKEAHELVANELFDFMNKVISKEDCLDYTIKKFDTLFEYYVS